MTRLFVEHALLPLRQAQGTSRQAQGTYAARDVTLEIDDATGWFTAVRPDSRPEDAVRLPGVALPGFANAHCHAFHRALRGRTHAGGGTFWTWREAMYAVAARLDPDIYLDLARAVYAELALAGVTTVGEFHYLHHGPGGVAYADPNAMASALEQAAADAGLRLTLLDTCYLAGGLDAAGHRPLDPVQERFGDGSAQGWAERFGDLRATDRLRVGAAIHSVRAVPRADLAVVADVARGGPLHAHVSEQPAENAAALAHCGRTPTALLDEAGALGPDFTAVHATYLTDDDLALLGGAGATACFCPTTERDLADGIGPARQLLDAGARLSLGSDANAVGDLLEEARALELDERLASGRRGRFTPDQLLGALTAHDGLGWPDAGALAVGRRADLVVVRTDTVRTAGARPEQVVLAASAADVDTVYVDGRRVVHEGRHRLGDVGRLLGAAIDRCWEETR